MELTKNQQELLMDESGVAKKLKNRDNTSHMDENIGVAKKMKISKDNTSVPTMVWNQDNILIKLYDEIDSLKRKLDQQMEMYNNLESNYRTTVDKNNELENKVIELSERTDMKDSKKSQSRYWTKEEHEKFLEALQIFGKKDVKNIALHVGSRNPTQVRTHAQKYFLKQKKRNREKNSAKRERFNAERRPISKRLDKISNKKTFSSNSKFTTTYV